MEEWKVPGFEENDTRECSVSAWPLAIQRFRNISVAQTEAAQSATLTFVRAILKVSRFDIALLTRLSR